jgi:hypothetical protein
VNLNLQKTESNRKELLNQTGTAGTALAPKWTGQPTMNYCWMRKQSPSLPAARLMHGLAGYASNARRAATIAFSA